MSDETIDVLAVLDAAHATFDNLRHERRHNDDALRQSMHWTARIEEIIKARAAIAELIEADREYDLAAAALLACTNKPAHALVTLIDYADKARSRLEAAKTRRGAAVARIGATK